MKIEIRVPSRAFVRRFDEAAFNNSNLLHAYVRVSDLPEIPLTPDPRKPKEKSPIVTRIANSVSSGSERFHLLNRGITISVSSAKYDPERSILTLDLPETDDFDKYGIIDGGHTYKTIRETVEKVLSSEDIRKIDLLENQLVHLEILEHVEEFLAEIAEARNFSVSLKAWTLKGYQKKFEWFLSALGDKRRFVKISENDPEPIGILELIQVMSAMNNTLYPNGEPPLEAYKNAGKCLDYFTDSSDKYEFEKHSNIALDMIKLYDHVRRTWAEKYNAPDETGKRGRYGKTEESRSRIRRRTSLATYYFESDEILGGSAEDIPIEKGFAIPMMGAFRPLIQKDENGEYFWYSNPFEFWENYGPQLVRKVKSFSDAAGNNPHLIGRDPQVHRALYDQARNALIAEYLEQQGKKLPF